MKIDRDTVLKMAHLARLEFNEEDLSLITGDLERILGFMEKLNELDVADVEPLIYMTDATNVLRKDIVVQEITHAQALQNAPSKDSDYFRVAKVIEQ